MTQDARAEPGPAPATKLHMVWPETRLAARPPVSVPPGYALRTFRDADADAHILLMRIAGFTYWTRENLDRFQALEEGFFVVEQPGSGKLVATAMARHAPEPMHPDGGELGWVAGDPAHRGHGLGRAVCAAATCRLLDAGYQRIYLKTDDWRLPAIAIYLRLGYVPLLYEADAEARWSAICARLGVACSFESSSRWSRSG